MQFPFLKSRTKSQPEAPVIGFAENEFSYCAVCYEAVEQPFFAEKSIGNRADFVALACAHFNITSPSYAVWALDSAAIWRKVFLFPAASSEAQHYKQIIHYIKQEVPISLNELTFDYSETYLAQKQLYYVILHVVKTEYVEPFWQENTILDDEVNCIYRAYGYLFSDEMESKQFDESYFKLGFKFRDVVLNFNAQDVTLFTAEEIESESEKRKLESMLDYKDKLKEMDLGEWRMKEECQSLYLLSLGAALWKPSV